MIKASTIGVSLLLATCASVEPAGAQAQVGSNGPNTALPTTTNMMSNPYLYMNPYLNSNAAQGMTGNNALLFLYAANQANGGIGTGRISGMRGAPTKTRVAEMPYTAHPGGGAARFFNPNAGAGVGAGRYFNQTGRRFQNNGH